MRLRASFAEWRNSWGHAEHLGADLSWRSGAGLLVPVAVGIAFLGDWSEALVCAVAFTLAIGGVVVAGFYRDHYVMELNCLILPVAFQGGILIVLAVRVK